MSFAQTIDMLRSSRRGFVMCLALGSALCLAMHAAAGENDERTEPEARAGETSRAESDAESAEGSERHFGTQEAALSTEGTADAEAIAGVGAPMDDTQSPLGGNGLTVQEATVGPTGGLSQSFPLQLLPARHGLTPTVAIQYAGSNRSNGPLGFGMELVAGGQITRRGWRGGVVPPHTYGAGYFSNFHWANERYQVQVAGQSQELLYTGAGATGELSFRPRYESHWRVTAPNQTQFDDWEALSPDGIRHRFTSHPKDTTDLTRNEQYLTVSLAPDEQTNTFYRYRAGKAFTVGGAEVGSRAVYLDKIRYSCALVESDTCYEVRFLYEPRDDVVITAQPGQVIAYAERLSFVQVYTPTGELAWQYQFTYVQDQINGRSLLHEIHQHFKGGQALLPPIRLTFSEAQPPQGKWNIGGTTLGALSYTFDAYHTWESGGKSVQIEGCKINPNDPSPAGACVQFIPGTLLSEAEQYTFGAGVLFADPNHDGLPDLIQRDIEKRDWINQGDGTFTPTTPAFDTALGTAGYWMRRHVTEATTIPGFKSSPTATPQPKAATVLKKVLDANVQIGDIDGDGQGDVLVNGTSMTTALAGMLGTGIYDLRGAPLPETPSLPVSFDQPGVVTVDLNGDGYVDLLQGTMASGAVGTQQRAWLYDPVAKAFVERPQWAPPIVFHRFGVQLGVQLTDLNGDGLMDLYSMHRKYPEHNGLFLNTGNGWLPVAADWDTAWDGGTSAPQVVVQAAGEKRFPASVDFPDTKPDGSVRDRSIDSGWRWFDLNADGIDDMVYAVTSIADDGKVTTEHHTLFGRATRRWHVGQTQNVTGDTFAYPFVTSMVQRFRSKDPNDTYKDGHAKTHAIDLGVRVLDLNGDRVADVVQSACTLGQASCQATVWHNPIAVPNVLQSVRAPMGVTSTFAHTTYAKYGEAVGGPPLVVQSVTVTNAAGTTIGRRAFTFAHPQYVVRPEADEPSEYDERRGPELLGFKEVRMTETGYHPEYGTVSERRTTSTYKAGYAFLGMVEQQDIEVREDLQQQPQAKWQLVRRQHQTYFDAPKSLPPYQPLVHLAETTQYGAGGPRTVRTEYQQYDAHGFPVAIHHHGRTDAAIGLADDVQETRLYTKREQPRILGLLERITTTANGLERSEQTTFDALGRPQQTTTTATGVTAAIWTSWSYDAYGNRSIERRSPAEPNGTFAQTRYFYDKNYGQFLIGQEDALAMRRMATYAGVNAAEPLASGASFGQLVRHEGTSTTAVAPAMHQLHTYDMFGRLVSRKRMVREFVQGQWTDVLGRQQTWEYAINAEQGWSLTTRTDHPSFLMAKGTPAAITEMTLNDRGQVTRVRTLGKSGWRQVLTDYGPYETVRRVSDPHRTGEVVRWTTTTVDALGRKILVETPVSVASYEYEPFRVRTVFADGQSSTVESDGRDRIVTRTHPGGGTSTIGYAADGRIVMTGPDGKVTTLHRDGLEQVIRRDDPDRGTWTWTFNAHGQQATQVDAKQITTRFHYDALDRVRAVDVQDDGVFDAEYWYDGHTPAAQSLEATALGYRSAMRDAHGVTRWWYNAYGVASQMEREIDGVTHRAAYTYDDKGRLTEYRHINPDAQPKIGLTASTAAVVDPILFTTQYQYDLDGLAGVRSRVGQQPWITSIATISYDGSGRLDMVTYGNGTQEDFAYDATTGRLQQRRVTKPAGGVLLDFTYAYDHPLGFISAITDAVTPAYSQTFTYHPDRSLWTATSQLYGEIAHFADTAGNLINHGDWTLSYADGQHPHAVSSAYNPKTKQQITYGYDANGNITHSWDRVFVYNPQNQLERITSSAGLIDFFHDGDGRRLRQVTTMWSSPPATPTMPPAKTSGLRPLPRLFQELVGIPTAAAAGSPTGGPTAPLPRRPATTPALVRPLGVVPDTHRTPSPAARQTPVAPRAKQPVAPKRTPGVSQTPLQSTTQTVTTPFDGLEIVQRDGKTERRYHVQAMDRRVVTITVGETAPVVRYYYADHLGSRTVVADATGTVSDARTQYTPYGTPLAATGQPQWSGWQDQTNMYVGVELPEVVALYLTGPRTYDPVIGRFLQPDALPGDPTGSVAANPYAYAMNNPVMALDPSGFSSESAQGSGGGWFGFLWNLAEGLIEMAVSGGRDFSFSFSIGANMYAPMGDGGAKAHVYNRRIRTPGQQWIIDHPDQAETAASLAREYRRVLSEYGIDPDDAPQLIFVDELSDDGEETAGHWDPSGPDRRRGGSIVLAATSMAPSFNHGLNTLYHEIGHYLHIGARVFDVQGLYIGSTVLEESVADAFMLRELAGRGLDTRGAMLQQGVEDEMAHFFSLPNPRAEIDRALFNVERAGSGWGR